MTIILEHTDQVEFHTDMAVIVQPFRDKLRGLNWLLTNLDFVVLDFEKSGLVDILNREKPFIYIEGEELLRIVETRKIQFIWGVFSGFKDEIPNMDDCQLPYADQNTELWTNPELFQIESAEIEIVCWDSSLTILKFKDRSFADAFMQEFKDSALLEKAKEKRTR